MSLLVYNTIESFPTVTIPLSKQFLKLIMFLFWKKNTTAFEYNNYLSGTLDTINSFFLIKEFTSEITNVFHFVDLDFIHQEGK